MAHLYSNTIFWIIPFIITGFIVSSVLFYIDALNAKFKHERDGTTSEPFIFGPMTLGDIAAIGFFSLFFPVLLCLVRYISYWITPRYDGEASLFWSLFASIYFISFAHSVRRFVNKRFVLKK